MSEDITLTCCPGCDREAALKADIARLTELANNLSDVVTRLNRESVELRAVLGEFANTEHHQPPVPLWISNKARKALADE